MDFASNYFDILTHVAKKIAFDMKLLFYVCNIVVNIRNG